MITIHRYLSDLSSAQVNLVLVLKRLHLLLKLISHSAMLPIFQNEVGRRRKEAKKEAKKEGRKEGRKEM
jgi:hypothetical protein